MSASATPDTVGVTIGVGEPHAAMARAAAACLKARTGIETVVLDEAVAERHALAHPSALRLAMFDEVPAENLLYFDADWFCLNPWDPRAFAGSPAIVACPDMLAFRDWPAQACDDGADGFAGDPAVSAPLQPGPVHAGDIADVGAFAGNPAPYASWINAGFLLANRTHHAGLMARALELFRTEVGCHDALYEQPALQRAIHDAGVPVHFLPRTYDALAASGRSWPAGTIAVHVKPASWPALMAGIRTLEDPSTAPELLEHHLGGRREANARELRERVAHLERLLFEQRAERDWFHAEAEWWKAEHRRSTARDDAVATSDPACPAT